MNYDRFKFRAWNKKESVMHYNAEYAYDHMEGKPVLMHDSFGGLLEDENYIVEQCTGLKDKNGKLIYEGDVLLFNGSRNPVYFDDGSFVILHSGSVFIPIKQKYTDVFEIIGNIHEMESEK